MVLKQGAHQSTAPEQGKKDHHSGQRWIPKRLGISYVLFPERQSFSIDFRPFFSVLDVSSDRQNDPCHRQYNAHSQEESCRRNHGVGDLVGSFFKELQFDLDLLNAERVRVTTRLNTQFF